MTEAAPQEVSPRATLSRELSELLIELSIGVHRFSMYPPGHPSLDPVVDNIVGRLGDVFAERSTLSIGVAGRQLVIDGVATDQRHPVLSDLARRLHEHQLAALSLERGVTPGQLTSLIDALAQESERDGTPLGMLPPEEFPRCEHARLFPVGYERLEMGDGTAHVGGAMQLWLGLAQAALASEELAGEGPDAATLARTIAGRGSDAAYDEAVAGYLVQLADQLKGLEGPEADALRGQVSALLGELDDETLRRLLQFGGDAEQRRRFVLDASEGLAVDAVLKIVRSAAESSGQTISTSMTRLLSKLATHAAQGTPSQRAQADVALRANVERLLDDWELADPNPEAYTAVLDEMASAAPIFSPPDPEDRVSGSGRIVQMALEVDAYGPTVARAVADLAAAGRSGKVLDFLKDARPGSAAARRIREELTSPEQFRKLLAGDDITPEALRALVTDMRDAAVDPLLDVLADSDSRSVRRRVFDLLPALGQVVVERAIDRLADNRWFVVRNMLALLQRLDPLPADFDPQPFLEHPDARVRREALPLAMRPGSRLRDRALVSALADADERMVRMGLLELKEQVPPATVPTLVNRVVSAEGRSAEIRAMAVRTLSRSDAPLARSALLDIVSGGKSLFGKPKLAPRTPVVVAALRALTDGFAGRPEVEEILELARRSKDPDLRGAVRPAPGRRT